MGWQHVYGHTFQKNFFQGVLSSGKVHHAYLLSGPSGVGKKTLALEVARALLCPESRGEGCHRCKSCLLFDRFSHPDFFLLQPEKNSIGIDDVRDFIQRISLKRVLSPFRVGIVDEAEKLTEEAANCLLKTVEEPPEGAVLFLVTSRISVLPETLVSRCQQVVFGALPEEIVEEYLVEERALERSRARAVALMSLGSIGEALHLATQGEYLAGEVRSFLEGIRRRRDIFRAGLWLSQHREGLLRILSLLVRYLRDALFLCLLGTRCSCVLSLPEEDRVLVEDLAHLDPQALRRSLEAVLVFLEDLSLNAQWDVACFYFLLQLRSELS